ncbi:MAG TPA: MlaD family protein [Solirubrobacteraceae bacterium]|jgi:virulence factor Mce-like protein|nr:MlaD family protein [Solirubrobacteraceae bacterium]
MQKQAPTLGRLLTMVLFALSCFGLLLFLWLSFGGAIPLKPKGYQFKVSFPQAVQLGLEADVRTAGIPVGRVVNKDLYGPGNRTVATVEVDPRFAPIHTDARAILRQKTLLGETFIELTPGTKGSPTVKEGAFLRNAQVVKNVYLDQVLQAFDPVTRDAFRHWQQDLAAGSQGRGQDLNDAFGTLPGFVASASDLLDVLNSQSDAVRGLVRNTGVTFAALNQNRAALHNLIVNGGQVFQATSDQQNALSQIFQIFPTFLDESKATFRKLQAFAINTHPLITELRPVARALVPTLRDVRAFAPDLRNFFRNLDPLITVSRTGLPALRDLLRATKPLLAAVDPFLEQLNPALQWIEFNQYGTGDFISNGGSAITTEIPAAAVPGSGLSPSLGHFLKTTGPQGAETAGIWPTRLPSSRGNAYIAGVQFADAPRGAAHLMAPNFDCKPSGGEVYPQESSVPGQAHPGCILPESPLAFLGNTLRFVHVNPAGYSP